MRKNGFTLAEILVVIALVAVVGIIMVAIFTNTLRGSNKSQVLSVIKQNGQAVLENMDKTIRGVDDVVCISSDNSTLVVVKYNDSTKTNDYTRFRLIPPKNTDPAKGNCGDLTGNANGCIQEDFPIPTSNDINAFVTAVCLPTNPLVNPQILTDTNTQTGVSAQNISPALFTLNQVGAGKVITINFQLVPAIGAPATIRGQIDPVPFQTTVKLRNS